MSLVAYDINRWPQEAQQHIYHSRSTHGHNKQITKLSISGHATGHKQQITTSIIFYQNVHNKAAQHNIILYLRKCAQRWLVALVHCLPRVSWLAMPKRKQHRNRHKSLNYAASCVLAAGPGVSYCAACAWARSGSTV